MGTGKGLKGFRLLAVAALVAAPSLTYAHALLVNPVPRDTTDTMLKMGPCGGDGQVPLLKGQPVAQFDAGATINVSFKETIGHVGCYQIRLSSTGDDKNFQLLKQIDDPSASQGAQTAQVTLPPGVTCQNCTLQLLQHMRDNATVKTCDPDASPTATGTTLYHSCADIRIGDFPDAGPVAEAGPGDSDGGGSSSGGTTTVPTDGGGKTTSDPDNGATSGRNLRSGAGDDGCNVGWGATSGLSFFVSAGIGALALLRRRRRS